MTTADGLGFAELLRRSRRTAGLTQEELAEQSSVSVRAISDLERGLKSRPHRDTVQLLADALGLTGPERERFQRTARRPDASPPALAAPASGMHAFLIADIRGYSRFTQEHGDAAAARLVSRFAALSREQVLAQGGAVLELRGDEALCVFASARQALHAAIALQQAYAHATVQDPSLPLQVGIGLDAGEAVPVDGGYRGAALNLAARLCSLAGGGEVLASEGLVHLAGTLEGVRYAERGAVQLKGFGDAVRVVQVGEDAQPAGGREELVEAGERPLPIGGFLGALPAGPLVAREEELERVLAVVEAVGGGSGRLVVLSGEPGIGKTRLAQEVTLQLRNRGFVVASGRCYAPQEAVPFYPFLEALETLYGTAPPAIQAAVPHRWPYLGRLLPNQNLPVPHSSAEGAEEQGRLFWAVTGFVRSLAEEQPVGLLLDDLHWADASSLGLLQHLARQTRAYPVLLLGAYRDVELGWQHRLQAALRDLSREQLVERIAVGRLGKDGTAAFIATTFGLEEVTARFTELVYGQTEGNPFFMQEVLRALVERGDIYRENGRWKRRGEVEELSIPESVRSTIRERLSRLPEETQGLLHEASVLGQTFAFSELQAMGNHSEEAVEAALDECMAAGVVREARRDVYSFHHALMQQTLYAELSGRRKRRLHLAAGEALERLGHTERLERTAELAWHFLEGDDRGRAMSYATLAGDRAQALFAHEEAARHYRLALQLAQERDESTATAELLEKLGIALKLTGRYDEALQALEQAAEMYRSANAIEAEARVAAQVGRLHADRGSAEEGIAYTRRMLEAFGGGDPTPGMAALYAALSFLYFAAGRYREQQTAAERASELARQFGDDEILAAAEVRRASALYVLGHGEQALAALLESIPLAERVGDLVSLHRAFAATSDYYRVAGQFGEAKLYRERSLEVANRMGTPGTIAFAMAALGRLYYFEGEWPEAGALLERALAIAGSASSWFAAFPAHHLAELRVAQGAWEEASQLLETAVTVSRRNGDIQALRFAQQTLAELDLLQGRPQVARGRLEPLLDRPGLAESQVTQLLPILARAELEAGNPERAERIAAEAISRGAAQNVRLATVEALLVRGALLSQQRRWDGSTQAFKEAIALARVMPYPHAEGRALYELGLMHRERGASRDARTHLEEALAIFRRLGARPYIERAEEALAGLR